MQRGFSVSLHYPRFDQIVQHRRQGQAGSEDLRNKPAFSRHDKCAVSALHAATVDLVFIWLSNKTENQSETCGLLKLEAVDDKADARFGLSFLNYPKAPILEAVRII